MKSRLIIQTVNGWITSDPVEVDDAELDEINQIIADGMSNFDVGSFKIVHEGHQMWVSIQKIISVKLVTFSSDS